MFDTMKATKILASLAGTLLILLFVNWGASSLYRVGPGEEHGGEAEEHAAVQGYVIAPEAGAETPAAATAAPEVTFDQVFATADAAAGEKVFSKCKSCHKLEEGANSTGPSLYGVVGRAVGSAPGFSYSDAVLGLGGDWTPDRLNEWLANPKAYAPGNKMTFAGLKKIEDRANLIAYLATIGG
jgi:cytochrome c